MEKNHYQKTDDVLAKFKHAKELYRSSAVFHSIVQQLVRGVSEYDIMEMLIIMMEDNNKALQSYVVREPYPKYYDLFKSETKDFIEEMKAKKL